MGVQSNGAATRGRGSGGASGNGFKPGQSGNPGGRPKGLAAAIRETVHAEDLRSYYEAIWRFDKAALKRLGIPLRSVTLRDRNDAGAWLTDRGYGKAPAFAPIEGENPLELTELGTEIEATLDDLAEKRAARAPGGSEAPPVAGAGTG